MVSAGLVILELILLVLLKGRVEVLLLVRPLLAVSNEATVSYVVICTYSRLIRR